MPRKTDSSNPKDWLDIATTELEAVRKLVTEEFAFDMCHSKLAEIVEKLLKADLIRAGWTLEKTHDLERLRKELRTRDQPLADSIRSLCAELAEVYFVGRYPGFDLEDPDWPKLREQIAAVTNLMTTVKARLGGS